MGRSRQEQREARSYSLLEATLESTADGILVVDSSGRIAGFNSKFGRMWNIPQQLMEAADDDALLSYVMAQLADPEDFMREVRRLYAHPDQSSVEELAFADGRVFERYSQPQLLDDVPVGRVWSFRDVTDYRQLESELRHQAHTDALTGLANRHRFMDELSGLAGGGVAGVATGHALLLIDVDDFKTVNDGLGHVAGDADAGRPGRAGRGLRGRGRRRGPSRRRRVRGPAGRRHGTTPAGSPTGSSSASRNPSTSTAAGCRSGPASGSR